LPGQDALAKEGLTLEEHRDILCGFVRELEAIVERDAQHLDGVNIATAMHSLAAAFPEKYGAPAQVYSGVMCAFSPATRLRHPACVGRIDISVRISIRISTRISAGGMTREQGTAG
jgi:hypothetical protein